MILKEVSPNTMSNTIDKYIIMTFSIVNNPYPCYPYKFITENYSSKIMSMSFWAPAPKSPAENDIPKKILDTSLTKCSSCFDIRCLRYLHMLISFTCKRDFKVFTVINKYILVWSVVKRKNYLCTLIIATL